MESSQSRIRINPRYFSYTKLRTRERTQSLDSASRYTKGWNKDLIVLRTTFLHTSLREMGNVYRLLILFSCRFFCNSVSVLSSTFHNFCLSSDHVMWYCDTMRILKSCQAKTFLAFFKPSAHKLWHCAIVMSKYLSYLILSMLCFQTLQSFTEWTRQRRATANNPETSPLVN